MTLFWFLIQQGGTIGICKFIILLSVSVSQSEQFISMKILFFWFIQVLMQKEAKWTWEPLAEHLLYFLL